jgi:hypothetical protein
MPIRKIVEGRLVQGSDERLRYSLTTTPWGSNPSSASVVAYDISDLTAWQDVSATVLDGDPEVMGDVINLPWVKGLAAGNLYRIEVCFTCGDNTFEAYLEVLGEK